MSKIRLNSDYMEHLTLVHGDISGKEKNFNFVDKLPKEASRPLLHMIHFPASASAVFCRYMQLIKLILFVSIHLRLIHLEMLKVVLCKLCVLL